MAGVRRVSRSILKYFVPLLAILVIVQIFLVGEGLFGATDETIEDNTLLNPHRDFGHMLGDFGAILLLIFALLAWHPVKRIRWWSIALPFILFVQTILPEGGRWVGALHPLNAFLILAVLGYLANRLWRPAIEPAAAA